MSTQRPPTIDPSAASRWAAQTQGAAPWLHEEVARRMQERLQWIKLQPRSWVDWEPSRGGLLAHATLRRHYPQAQCYVVEPSPGRQRLALQALRKPWWSPSRWVGVEPSFETPAPGAMQMVWANMGLHMAADPQALITRWHQLLATDGFLMFSCLGPDSLRELRDLYRGLGWPAHSHEFTDMHDWGDMLVNAGFAEPVMDMEHITLTFENGPRLLEELRQLGRNLHPARFPGLRGRRWREQLLQALANARSPAHEPHRLALTFEIIYGHALRPAPRLPMKNETILPLDEMRRQLRQGSSGSAGRP